MQNIETPFPGFDVITPDHHRDNRGWNVHPVDYALLESGGVDNIHVVSISPGSTRGNHLHRRQTEYILIIGGPCLVAAADPVSGQTFSTTVNPGDVRIFRASPGIAHAFKNTAPPGSPDCYLLCHSNLRFNPADGDTEPFTAIPA